MKEFIGEWVQAYLREHGVTEEARRAALSELGMTEEEVTAALESYNRSFLKTVNRELLSTLRMGCKADPEYVILGGKVRHYVGIGWVETRTALQDDYETLPVVANPDGSISRIDWEKATEMGLMVEAKPEPEPARKKRRISK